jgi:hypothetical protein
MSDENSITPASVFLDVQHKIENRHNFSAADAKIDFQRLFTALRASLAENEGLRAQIKSADDLLSEKDIEIFNKDLEIFNAVTQFDSLKETK